MNVIDNNSIKIKQPVAAIPIAPKPGPLPTDNIVASGPILSDNILENAEVLSQKIIAKCFGNNGGVLDDPMEFIKSGMELVKDIIAISVKERKLCVIAALKIVACGKDGIAGTDDDLIAPETLKMLNIMIEHSIVDHIIEALLDAAKGRLNILAIKDTVEDVVMVGVGCYDWCKWRVNKKSKK